MKSKEIPFELLSVVGKLIRQGRTARGLTLDQAADIVGLSTGELTNLEKGSIPATTDHLMFILACYGGVRGDAAEGLIFRLIAEEARCRSQTEQRKHLSLAGASEERPWEKMKYSEVSRGV